MNPEIVHVDGYSIEDVIEKHRAANKEENANDFNKHIKINVTDNRVNISCIKGLWGVSAPTMSQALSEARHYYQHYLRDGEYDELGV